MITDQGDVNGRKIDFLSLDDGYSPPKTVELARRLVEQDRVLGLFGPLGSATNAAMQRNLNEHKVPQFFTWSGIARFHEPKALPWTIGGNLALVDETKAFAIYVLEAQPAARIGVRYQNDVYGQDHLRGFQLGLGDKAQQMIKAAFYEATDATVESHILELKQAGADVVLIAAIPKFAVQAIRKIHDLEWNQRFDGTSWVRIGRIVRW